MYQNTLFNYFTKSPSVASKTNGSSSNDQSPNTPKRPPKENLVTPKRTPKSVNGSSKKTKISNSGSKKTTEKRKPKVLGNILTFFLKIILHWEKGWVFA